MSHVSPRSAADDRLAWFIVRRWQEYDAESRANLLRIVGIGAFYTIELVNVDGLQLGWLELPAVAGVKGDFHVAVTALAVAWTLVALATQVCLRRHIFPAALKYVTTTLDVVLLTAILMVADGPRSPLVVGYPLVIALAAMRFNLPLVRWATVTASAGYLSLLGYARWFTDRDLSLPRYQQLIFLMAIVLTGVVLGQIVRQAQRMAEQFALRSSGATGGEQ